ncbi:hypothetical protein BU24DRAFT_157614 [Aaosphaeria arxii CBS 175.79]|uniref:Zn(2)-C6 fungal-type domain-containing protein n=1 Tax=Aaosphaeria arxii CBS 175.79 TaxID=1450172 RepID=A0A6A5XXR2_9PLEO|nr:uncharacterized protein BU24DRAFT_157614 [Aaosphaeria arxii CBS 175.79]KAF2017746.1 hypothetical protein BU24DRAFT_157614 [Aaosphaeria arxii CBS 175.79]
MPQFACDQCHRRKERCSFDADERSCRQCKVQSVKCSFLRRSRRMGRPPAARKLPYGSCKILSFDKNQQPSRRPISNGLIVLDSSVGAMVDGRIDGNHSSHGSRSNETHQISESPINASGATQTLTGGGTCHEINETNYINKSNESVKSLQTNSSNTNSETNTGLKSQETDSTNEADEITNTSDIDEINEINNISEMLAIEPAPNEVGFLDSFNLNAIDIIRPWQCPGLDTTSQQSLLVENWLPPVSTYHNILSNSGLFYLFHRHFMIGPSFCDDFVNAIKSVFTGSDGFFLEAYNATLALWDVRNNRPRIITASDIKNASHFLRQLQKAAIQGPFDAAAIVFLGQILLVHHVVAFGTSAHAIVRRSLLSVREWYASLLLESSMNPITITPIVVDTVESLVRRDIPVVQIPRYKSTTVDRTAGLCVELLHFQYDICKISYAAKITGRRSIVSAGATTPSLRSSPDSSSLDALEEKVRQWEPSPPLTFFTEYTPSEVSAMLLQARVYRLATLLIIHRLKYPLGVEDEYASRLALLIMVELECFTQQVTDTTDGLAIGLPLLVSALETGYLNDRIVSYVAPVSANPDYAQKLQDFVSLVRAARDHGYLGLWFDLVEGGLHVPILP